MSQTYTEDEIRQLLLYVKEMGDLNEELRAKIIAMDAMLKNEMAKTKRLLTILNGFNEKNMHN